MPTHYFVVVTRMKVEGDYEVPEDTLTNHEILSIILPHKPDIQNCMVRLLAFLICRVTHNLRWLRSTVYKCMHILVYI